MGSLSDEVLLYSLYRAMKELKEITDELFRGDIRLWRLKYPEKTKEELLLHVANGDQERAAELSQIADEAGYEW